MTQTLLRDDRDRRSSAARLVGPLATAGVVAGLTLALHVRDPHTPGSWGICPTQAFLGVECPGCGGLRAVNNLTNGDLIGAASSNLLFVLAVPLIIVGWAFWLRRSLRGERWTPDARARWAVPVLVALLVVFTVVRNLPGSPLAS